MSRLGRLVAVMLLSSSTLLVTASGAFANHCEPRPAPKPINEDRYWCHTAPPTQEPETPKPTTRPTTAPATAAPSTPRPAPRTQAPVVRTNPSTPAATPFDLEVPQEDPLATPQIVVDGPLDDQTNFEVAEPAAGVSSWIFGFIFGFIVGGFVGRASWGLRKRRRQQIFG